MEQLHISHHTAKMNGFKSISTSSLDNIFCQSMQKKGKNFICHYCYSKNTENRYPSLKNPLIKNGIILSKSILKERQMPIINDLFFRFNSFGELINTTHYKNLCLIANNNKKTTFGLWTKRPDVIYKSKIKKPKNIILIYSNPLLNKSGYIPKNFDKVFNVLTKDFIKFYAIKDKINCQKTCIECLLCYTKNDIKEIFEIKK